jgi:hypothetical protein
MTMPPSHSSPLQPSRGEDTIQTTRDDRSSGAEDSYRADALRLGERLRSRSVMSGRSVWLSVGGGLTLVAAVDPVGV